MTAMVCGGMSFATSAGLQGKTVTPTWHLSAADDAS